MREAVLASERNATTLISDLAALFKAGVLIANVLPVFTGFWLALHFTNASFIANWELFLLTIIGSTSVMAGALLFNNWYDVDIDTVMERTRHRPTVTGNISLNVVFIMGITFTVFGFALLLFTTVQATIYALVGWFTYVVLYTIWSKRRYSFNTVIGSISGAVTPLIGWAAVKPGFYGVPMVLFLILFIWQMPHAFSIAMKKCTEYKAAGVAMLPVVHGFKMAKWQIVIYITCLFPLPFYLASLGPTFLVITTLLNVSWLVVSISGFFMRNDLTWAHLNFIYSVNYVTILFLLMVVCSS